MSYRRSDSGGHAGRLRDSLAARIGAGNVFHDVSAIAPGEDYIVALERSLDRADAVLAVIGPDWLDARGPGDLRRLDDPDDWVHLEIAQALEHEITVIPVLVGGAALPNEQELPDALRALSRRQAVTLHDDSWQVDVDRLVRALRGETEDGSSTRHRWGLIAVPVVLMFLGAAVTWWWWSSDGEGSSTDTVPPLCDIPASTGWTSIPVAEGATGALPEGDRDGQILISVDDLRWRPDGNDKWFVLLDTTMDNQTSVDQYHGHWLYRELVIDGYPFEPSCFRTEQQEVASPSTRNDAWVGFRVECRPTGRIVLTLDTGINVDLTSATERSDCSI